MEAILIMDSNCGLSEKGILPWQNKNHLNFLYKITITRYNDNLTYYQKLNLK